MTSNFDWSQFPEASIEKAAPQGFDWNQFPEAERGPSIKGLLEKIPSAAKTELEPLPKAMGLAGLGAAKLAAFPATVQLLAQKAPGAGELMYRQQVMEDIENLADQKATGVWSPKDEEHFQHLQSLIKEPEKLSQFVPKDVEQLDPSNLLETAFEKMGVDISPKNMGEQAIEWMGMIKDPKRSIGLVEDAINAVKDPKKWGTVAKKILPNLPEAARGVGAATALQVAADNEWGPIGTMAAAIVGDLTGLGVAGLAKGIGKVTAAPKQTLGKAVGELSKLSNNEKLMLQQDLVNAFREAGIQADLGSITGSNLVKAIQARLSQSGFTGAALDEFRNNLTKQIIDEYKSIANGLGEAKYSTLHDAGSALKEGITDIRDADKARISSIYDSAKSRVAAPDAVVVPDNLVAKVNQLESELLPGEVKGAQQKAVLDILNQLKKDILDENGLIKLSNVRDLINNKVALNDIIDYEALGGAKNLLKDVVRELDKTIEKYGNKDPAFLKEWKKANKDFAVHAKTYRNKTIADVLKGQDPAALMNKMNSVQGIKDIENALVKTPEGRIIFNDLKRAKFEDIVMKNMVDGMTDQLKLGKFSNILEKGKNRDLVLQLLGPESFGRLQRLQKSTGILAESAQKFFNASKSGTTAIDAAIATKALFDLGSLLTGNPWPLMRTASGIATTRLLSNLITDPVFLKSVEDAMLAGKSNNLTKLKEFINYLAAPIVGEDLYRTKNIEPSLASPEELLGGKARRIESRIEEIKPKNALQGGDEFSGKVLEKQPQFIESPTKREISIAGLKEPPRQIINPRNKLSLAPQEEILYRRQWDKYFPPELFDKVYNNEKAVDQIGTLGDFLQGEKSRKIFKDVLDVPIVKDDRMPLGKRGNYQGFYDPSPGAKKGKLYGHDRILISTRLEPTDLLSTLYHEGWHARQALFGKIGKYPLPKVAPTSDPFLRYLQKPEEIRARLFQKWALKDVERYRRTHGKVKELIRGPFPDAVLKPISQKEVEHALLLRTKRAKKLKK